MAKGKSTAIQKTSDEQAEIAALAECSEFFDQMAIDGMEDVGGEDLKLAVKLWNMKGLDSNAKAYPKDVFFDTISEETCETIETVMLLTQKSNRWDEFDNAQDKTIVFCTSEDRITGMMRADNSTRPCKSCPDRGWFKDEKGDPKRKCGEVHTVVALERASQRPFLIRFKKTALKPFRTYVMRHHWGARVAADGSRKNVPLFAYSMTLSLAMDPGGLYAIPVLERGAMLSRDHMEKMHENAKAYLEIMSEVLVHADAQTAKHTTSERDANLSSDDFADG